MTNQTRAIAFLRGLKAAGVSYRALAQAAGFHVDNIYALTSRNVRLTDERADFYIRAIERFFPEQYRIIKTRIDNEEITHPDM